MKPLESQKQLLIAESELNRLQSVQEWEAVATGVRTVTDRVKSLGSLASTAAVVVSGLAAFKGGQPMEPGAKPSRWRKVLKGAGLVSNLWLAFGPRHDGSGES